MQGCNQKSLKNKSDFINSISAIIYYVFPVKITRLKSKKFISPIRKLRKMLGEIKSVNGTLTSYKTFYCMNRMNFVIKNLNQNSNFAQNMKGYAKL